LRIHHKTNLPVLFETDDNHKIPFYGSKGFAESPQAFVERDTDGGGKI